MKPDPIYIRPGTFAISGSSGERLVQDLEQHIERLQVLLGEDLRQALAGMGESVKGDPSAMISFTGAFTGLSTLLHFCSFTRGIIALEKGMETHADKNLVGKLRELLVPIVTSQCEILGASMQSNLGVRAASILHWYENAIAEVQTIHGFIGRLG
jgi:hypothetical protein